MRYKLYIFLSEILFSVHDRAIRNRLSHHLGRCARNMQIFDNEIHLNWLHNLIEITYLKWYVWFIQIINPTICNDFDEFGPFN